VRQAAQADVVYLKQEIALLQRKKDRKKSNAALREKKEKEGRLQMLNSQ